MRLIDYIEESREVVGKLPFDLDLFTQYAKCRIFGSSNSDPFYEMFGVIKRSFTNNTAVWDCLNGYIDTLGKLKHIRQSDIKSFCRILRERRRWKPVWKRSSRPLETTQNASSHG